MDEATTTNPDDPTIPPPLATDREPWVRQPGESEAAYRAFTLYLNLQGRRSTERLGRESYPGRGTRKRGRTGRLTYWCRRWRWWERVDAWDRHCWPAVEEAWRQSRVEWNARRADSFHARQAARDARYPGGGGLL